MKTLTTQHLLKAFPPTKSILGVGTQFRVSGDWLTNGYFLIKKSLEPKQSRGYRYIEAEINTGSVLQRVQDNLSEYQEAEVVNQFEYSFDRNFLVKLQSSEHEAWVNPRYISYIYSGLSLINDFKIMIGKNVGDPIAFVSHGEIVGLVMGFRRVDNE